MPVNEPYIKQKICDSEIGEKKVSKLYHGQLGSWAHKPRQFTERKKSIETEMLKMLF